MINNNYSQIEQTQLALQYHILKSHRLNLPKFSETGFRVFSQNDEDGLLHYIFSLIGTNDKKCLDIAFGSPIGSNTTNLMINRGWSGYLVCGDIQEVKGANDFFRSQPDTKIYPPKIVQQWVTAENINQTVAGFGLNGEIDLLSLDVDGMDFWLWRSLEVVSPRVIVIEYQDILGDISVTVPYKPDFDRMKFHEDYFGASLPALVKLGKTKGYRLVGCNKYGFNAFFVKNGIGDDLLPEVSAKECLKHPKVIDGIKTRLPKVANFNWLEV